LDFFVYNINGNKEVASMENNIATLQVRFDKLVKEQDELIEFLNNNSRV